MSHTFVKHNFSLLLVKVSSVSLGPVHLQLSVSVAAHMHEKLYSLP